MIAFFFFGWLLVFGPGFHASLQAPGWCEQHPEATEFCARLVVR